jgi:hypothetical protein
MLQWVYAAMRVAGGWVVFSTDWDPTLAVHAAIYFDPS